MKCPVDGETLTLSERSGIEIDYCPSCRGVWLDRGELDKLIERSLVSGPPAGQGQSWPAEQRGHHGQQSSHGSNRDGHGNGYQNGRRRGGWLGDLFGD